MSNGLIKLVGSAAAAAATLACAPALAHVTAHGDHVAAGADRTLVARTTLAQLRSTARADAALTRRELASVWCGHQIAHDETIYDSSSGPAIKVVYARPADMPDRFGVFADLIQDDVRQVAAAMAAAALDRTLRFDTGTACGGDYVDIASVVLPRERQHYVDGLNRGQRFARIHDHVRTALGAAVAADHLLIYADTLAAGDGVIGLGALYDDAKSGTDRPGADNPHNAGGLAGILLGDSTATATNARFSGQNNRQTAALHELTHALGAVQFSAPHATAQGHCRDVYDLMCYADGSAGGTTADIVQACPDSTPRSYDCNNDDYFHRAPAPGSYLDTHWNVYRSVFLCPIDTCIGGASNRSPRAAFVVRDGAGAAVTEAVAGTTVLLDGSASLDLDGTIAAWTWDVGDDGVADAGGEVAQVKLTQAGTHAIRLVVRDAAGAPNAATAALTVTPAPQVAVLAERAVATPRSSVSSVRAAKKALARRRVAVAVRKGLRKLRALGAPGFARRGVRVRLRSPLDGVLSGTVRSAGRVVALNVVDAPERRTVTLRLRATARGARWLAKHPRSALRLGLDFQPD